MSLVVENLACGYGNRTVIKNIQLSINTGDILCILGPNGVGKTTLFKTIQGFLPLHNGKIIINGQNISTISQKKLAHLLAYVPQTHETVFPFRVIDVVVMGRTAHLGIFSTPGKKDYKICQEILEKLNIGHLTDKVYTEISGGEKQLALIARALVQKPQFLLMDEPTSNLDFGNQVKVLQQIVNLSRDGIAVIMTSHFPDHAFLCSAKTALFRKDRSLVTGAAEEVITEESLKEAYGIPVKMSVMQDDNGFDLRTCVPILEKDAFQVHKPECSIHSPSETLSSKTLACHKVG